MKKILIYVLLFGCGSAFAWNYGANVTVTSVTLWEGSQTNPMYFKRSDEVWCYVPADEPTTHSLILLLYVSGKHADIHCHDEAEEKVGGMNAHRLHRIVTL